jgi:hypothetical protein
MNALASIFSYGDSMKRKVGRLLKNPLEEISLGATRFNEDQQRLSNLADEAGFTPGSRNSVLISPEQRQQARKQLTDLAMETYGNMAGMLLYHGSNAREPIKQIDSGGAFNVFDGIFASPSKNKALSHGDSLYRITMPDKAIMPHGNLSGSISGKKLSKALKETHKDSAIRKLIASGESAYDGAVDEGLLLKKLGADDMGSADWELQRLRGLLADKLGYKAAAMPDEHGLSYLVLPGTKPRPFNEKAKALWRNGAKP